jgi:hypothetical protein
MRGVFARLAYLRKSDAVFRNNVNPFLKQIGLRAGVLTLTFKGNLQNKEKADRAFAKFAKEVLVPHFGPYIRVAERQQRGAWHFHVIIDCLADVRTGYDFEGHLVGPEFSNFANPELRRLRRLVKDGAPRCGFGPLSTLVPLDIARAHVLYLAKKIGRRDPLRSPRRRERLVSYGPGFPRRWWHRFSLLTDKAFRWRQFVKLKAEELGCENLDDLYALLGPNWAFKFMLTIAKDPTVLDGLPGAPEAFKRMAPP